MGSSPANEVKKEKKWCVQVNYVAGNNRTSTTLEGLDAPTESEVLKALYKRCPQKYSDIEITNQWTVYK